MAHGLKCYCCGITETGDRYYCYECLKKLKAIFESECCNILETTHHSQHCNSCGEWENRRIIEEVHVCDKCVKQELLEYEQEHTL